MPQAISHEHYVLLTKTCYLWQRTEGALLISFNAACFSVGGHITRCSFVHLYDSILNEWQTKFHDLTFASYNTVALAPRPIDVAAVGNGSGDVALVSATWCNTHVSVATWTAHVGQKVHRLTSFAVTFLGTSTSVDSPRGA